MASFDLAPYQAETPFDGVTTYDQVEYTLANASRIVAASNVVGDLTKATLDGSKITNIIKNATLPTSNLTGNSLTSLNIQGYGPLGTDGIPIDYTFRTTQIPWDGIPWGNIPAAVILPIIVSSSNDISGSRIVGQINRATMVASNVIGNLTSSTIPAANVDGLLVNATIAASNVAGSLTNATIPAANVFGPWGSLTLTNLAATSNVSASNLIGALDYSYLVNVPAIGWSNVSNAPTSTLVTQPVDIASYTDTVTTVTTSTSNSTTINQSFFFCDVSGATVYGNYFIVDVSGGGPVAADDSYAVIAKSNRWSAYTIYDIQNDPIDPAYTILNTLEGSRVTTITKTYPSHTWHYPSTTTSSNNQAGQTNSFQCFDSFGIHGSNIVGQAPIQAMPWFLQPTVTYVVKPPVTTTNSNITQGTYSVEYQANIPFPVGSASYSAEWPITDTAQDMSTQVVSTTRTAVYGLSNIDHYMTSNIVTSNLTVFTTLNATAINATTINGISISSSGGGGGGGGSSSSAEDTASLVFSVLGIVVSGGTAAAAAAGMIGGQAGAVGAAGVPGPPGAGGGAGPAGPPGRDGADGTNVDQAQVQELINGALDPVGILKRIQDYIDRGPFIQSTYNNYIKYMMGKGLSLNKNAPEYVERAAYSKFLGAIKAIMTEILNAGGLQGVENAAEGITSAASSIASGSGDAATGLSIVAPSDVSISGLSS